MTLLRYSPNRSFMLGLTVAFMMVFTYFLYENEDNGIAANAVNEVVGDLQRSTDDQNHLEPKIILYWTRWYAKSNGFNFGYGSEIFKSCPVSNCLTTDNRTLFNQSSAVLFHLQGGDFYASHLPTYRFPHQRFVMYFFEPTIFSNRQLFNSAPAHFFNWTFSWRRFSDIASNIYGDYKLKPDSFGRNVVGQYEMEESLEDYYGVNITGKTIMAAWFSSHCQTDVKRETFVAELQKHIRVDIYGKCGNFRCRKEPGQHESAACDALIGRDYLFYLSFENSLCPDYVTEKLYRPLRAGAVPIVFGSAHYSRFAPPHSYINALEYSSPKELADYLLTLSNNRKLYAHYLEWRRHFEIVKYPIDDWCALCQMLNDPSLPLKTYANISQWWFDYYPCEQYEWKLSDGP